MITTLINSHLATMNSPEQNSASLSRRSLSRMLEPLDRLAAGSVHLIANHSARFQSGGESYVLPRYLFVGPKGGDEPLRIGVFAGIHGDEPEGIHALIRFLSLLESQPELAEGYRIFAYPICNPTGVEDSTRNSRNGKDLNREFWRESAEPEVLLLQSELVSHSFHGIISLHTDDTSHGFYGYARGATLTRNLIEPALTAASEFLPLNRDEIIDGFDASSSIIHEKSFEGILSSPPKVRPRPFEIILETPKAAPEYMKEGALSAALQTILARYREFISYASNI